jgi:prolipoprotein diacylglyceryltransferase
LHFPAGDPHVLYHPAQIYASIINLGLVALLIQAYRRPHHVGQILALYIGGYSIYRFLIEFLRKGVTADVLVAGLTQAQVFSLLAIAGAVAGWFWLRKHAPPAPELVPPQLPTPTATPRQAGV